MVDVLNSNNIEIRVGEEITRALMQTKTGAEELLNKTVNHMKLQIRIIKYVHE